MVMSPESLDNKRFQKIALEGIVQGTRPRGRLNNDGWSGENLIGGNAIDIVFINSVIAPFWFSTEHRRIVITPFWLSTDDTFSVAGILSFDVFLCGKS